MPRTLLVMIGKSEDFLKETRGYIIPMKPGKDNEILNKS